MDGLLAFGALILIGALTVGGIRFRRRHQRKWDVAPDLRRADDTSPGGDVRDVGWADKTFLGGDGF